MKFENFQITPERFYKIGMYAFLIVAIMNVLNFFYLLEFYNLFSGISTWAMIVFYFVLAGFFHYFLKQQPQVSEQYASDDVEEIIKQINGEPPEIKPLTIRCKAITSINKQCLNKAVKEGLCMIHYKQMLRKKPIVKIKTSNPEILEEFGIDKVPGGEDGQKH